MRRKVNVSEQVSRGPGRPRTSSREEIEEKAIDFLLTEGYANTTFSALAQACGVSKTTLFRHFSSKSSIVEAGFDMAARARASRRQFPAEDPGVPVSGVRCP